MRMTSSVLLTILLLSFMPVSTMAEPLIDTGVVEQLEADPVHIDFMPSGEMLLVEANGLVRVGSWENDDFTESWNLDLNISANTAALDPSGQFIAVGINTGVIFVNIDIQNVSGSIDTISPVQSLAWDIDNDLWVGHHGGNQRKAVEYDTNGASGTMTGISSTSHGNALTAFAILSDGRIATCGNDRVMKIHLPNGLMATEHTSLSNYPTQLIVDSNDRVIVGLSDGRVYRFNTTADDGFEYVAISSSQSINSLDLDDDDNILVGTSNGRFHMISEETFTETAAHSTSNRVIKSWQGDGSKFYVMTQFSSTVK